MSLLPRLSPAQYSLNSAESWPKTPFIHSIIYGLCMIKASGYCLEALNERCPTKNAVENVKT